MRYGWDYAFRLFSDGKSCGSIKLQFFLAKTIIQLENAAEETIFLIFLNHLKAKRVTKLDDQKRHTRVLREKWVPISRKNQNYRDQSRLQFGWENKEARHNKQFNIIKVEGSFKNRVLPWVYVKIITLNILVV